LFIGKANAQDSLRTVVAKNGDGIYSLLKKYDLDSYKNYQEFIHLNKKNIRGKEDLYKGRTYYLPATTIGSEKKIKSLPAKENIPVKKKSKTVSKSNIYPMFGKKYEKIPIKSSRLKGTVYYLVAGHGGPDPGALGKYNGKLIAEDEYAYDVTLRLARELISHGAKTYIIIKDLNDGIRDQKVLKIDTDEVNYPNRVIPLNQVARLKQRVKTVNGLYLKNKGKYQRLIVIHVDSRSKGENIDVFFYHHKKSKSGLRLAKSIHETFKKKYKRYQPNRTYSGSFSYRNLYLVNFTLPPMAFIEIGNIQNEKDQKRIVVPENRQALAKWISEGVLLDYKQRK
jgi:N-acetylmuramoyl-L-alanine amidase